MPDNLPCPRCKRTFVDGYALRNHQRAKHEGKKPKPPPPRDEGDIERRARVDLLDTIAGDESDGVFWGMAEEMGVDVEDLL